MSAETESFRRPAGATGEVGRIEGKCNCGAVQVFVDEPAFQGAVHVLCHCQSCRTSSGALASSNLVVSSESLTFDGSTLSIKSYRDTQTDSGNVAVRHFCDNCGTPIRTVVEGKEETSFLKSGLFGHGKLPSPVMEIFTRNCEAFEKPVEGAKVCSDSP